MGDTIDHRVAHHKVRRCHVDFCPQDACPVGELTRAHTREEIEIFLHGTIAVRAFHTCLGQRSAMGTDLICREVVHIGKPLLYQCYCIFIHLLEVIRCVETAVVPREAEPADILLNGVHVLDIFLRRICIVKAQIAEAMVVLGNAEVETDGLRVPDVQVAVRLGREARVNPLRVPSRTQILVDDISDKIRCLYVRHVPIPRSV